MLLSRCNVPLKRFASVRSKSSSAAAAASKCPITGAGGGNDSDSGATTVKLHSVPKLPFVGSIIPQHSGVDKLDLTKSYDWWLTNRQKFGDFYSLGLPGLGKDIVGTTYVLTDPNEYMKVLRKEGQHPFGAVMTEWPFIKYYEDGGDQPGFSAGKALFSQGESWQRIRRFMQTDLLSPAAAKGYVPGMIKACQIASQGAPLHASNISAYTTQCSFDMFSSIVFGGFPGLAGGGSKEEQDELFCTSSINATELIVPMLTDPVEIFQKSLGFKSKIYTTFEENFTVARNIATQKIESFIERKANGELSTVFEKNSYASLALDRYLDSVGEEGALKEEEVVEIIMVALIAALDTTSAMLNWCIVHLAMNPHVQEELFQEISSNLSKTDGQLTTDYFTKSNSAYLSAVLRENHRVTPPIALNLTKENVTDEIEIHDENIPKQSTLALDTRSIGMDPSVVDDPDKFDPTRWLDGEAERRKGTSAEVLDHPLYREPFSAGARKCPGSRVASYEAKVMLSQLVLDWKISLAADNDKIESWRDVPYFNGLTVQPCVPNLSFEKRQ